MRRLRNHYIGIEQGDQVMFSDFADGGPMWSGNGSRESRSAVVFSEEFRSPPNVMVSLSMWDTSSDHYSRMDVRAESIKAEGFDIVFRTWEDSKIARVRVGWMAIGELRHADEWDLY